jgi:hypothetical protein
MRVMGKQELWECFVSRDGRMAVAMWCRETSVSASVDCL